METETLIRDPSTGEPCTRYEYMQSLQKMNLYEHRLMQEFDGNLTLSELKTRLDKNMNMLKTFIVSMEVAITGKIFSYDIDEARSPGIAVYGNHLQLIGMPEVKPGSEVEDMLVCFYAHNQQFIDLIQRLEETTYITGYN